MVHLDRIHEEIRVLNIKDETLLSFRVFENFNKRLDHFKTIKLGGGVEIISQYIVTC